MGMDRQTIRLITEALTTAKDISASLDRIADAQERLAEMAEQDPLRAVDRLLAMGVDPSDPASALETMDGRATLLDVDHLRNAATGLQDGPERTEGADPVSGIERNDYGAVDDAALEALTIALEHPPAKPSAEQVAAARARAAERAGTTTAQPPINTVKAKDEEMDTLPASERWRLE